MKRNSFLIALCIFMFLSTMTYAENATWDKKSGKGRFVVLSAFNTEAVLDKETGLVWERFLPEPPKLATFLAAHSTCNLRDTGNRFGWRLPTVQELASLLDPQQDPALPPGHPFENVRVNFGDQYWSSTLRTGESDFAWAVSFGRTGSPASNFAILTFSIDSFVWCVRGGQGADTQ